MLLNYLVLGVLTYIPVALFGAYMNKKVGLPVYGFGSFKHEAKLAVLWLAIWPVEILWIICNVKKIRSAYKILESLK